MRIAPRICHIAAHCVAKAALLLPYATCGWELEPEWFFFFRANVKILLNEIENYKG